MGKTKCISILPMGKCREPAKWLVEKKQHDLLSEFYQAPRRGVNVPNLHFCKADRGIGNNTRV